jgi:hypothetical protein
MRAKAGAGAIAMMAMLAVAGCSAPRGDGTDLMNLKSKDGPDEFAILPPKPLDHARHAERVARPHAGRQQPHRPHARSRCHCGTGGQAAGPAGGIPAADGALYAQAARYGVDAGIRDVLAGEDLEWRRDNKGRILERLFNVNVYYRAYRKQSLDQHAELEFWRARGVRTPLGPAAPKGRELGGNPGAPLPVDHRPRRT